MVLYYGFGQRILASGHVKRKAAFMAHEGLYQFRAMPFGLLKDLWTECCVACVGHVV